MWPKEMRLWIEAYLVRWFEFYLSHKNIKSFKIWGLEPNVLDFNTSNIFFEAEFYYKIYDYKFLAIVEVLKN